MDTTDSRRPGSPRLRRGPLGAVALGLLLTAGLVAWRLGVWPGDDGRDDDVGPVTAAIAGAYVALGDSYSSGEGVWEGGTGGGDCHRSEGSYTREVARAYPFRHGSALWACSGARTGDLWQEGRRGEGSQLSHVDARTSLITLTIGGNDAGFTDVFSRCVVKLPWSSACRDQDTTVRTRLAVLGGDLRTALDRLTERARNARVIVVGYPRPFPASPHRRVNNMSVDDQRWLNGIARELDTVIRTTVESVDRRIAAAHAPGGVEFLDTYDAYAGHEITTAQPYLQKLHFGLTGHGLSISQSYHPNADGNRRTAELVVGRIAAGPPGWRYCTLTTRCR